MKIVGTVIVENGLGVWMKLDRVRSSPGLSSAEHNLTTVYSVVALISSLTSHRNLTSFLSFFAFFTFIGA